jgi:hypothetical protein
MYLRVLTRARGEGHTRHGRVQRWDGQLQLSAKGCVCLGAYIVGFQ